MMARGDTLVLRAHLDADSGLGHFCRLLALGIHWVECGGRALLVGDEVPASVARAWGHVGVEFLSLSGPGRGDGGDGAEVARIAQAAHARWIAVDGYIFRGEFFAGLEVSGARVLVVDDHGIMGAPRADVVVDPAFQAEKSEYEARLPGARVLAGARFALLRPEFRRVERRVRQAARPQRLLVTFGGADPVDGTARVLRALGRLQERPQEVLVALGPRNSRPDEHFIEAGRALPSLRLSRDPSNMARLMIETDATISAAGTTMHELAAVGAPALLCPIVDNQADGVRHVAGRGLFAATPMLPTLSDEALAAALNDWLGDPARMHNAARMAREEVDGRGVERAVEALRVA